MENILGNTVNIVFTIMLIAMAVLVLVRIISDLIGKKRYVSAEIVKKEMVSNTVYKKNTEPQEKVEYLITYKLVNGEIVLSVSEGTYQLYEIGDEGILGYKGTKFIDFISVKE